MGTKMGPSYANLFVGYIEHQFFNQYNGPKPDLYRCYIDDCVGATSPTREELNQFITAVNSFHPALKYTWEISDTSLAFLDIKVSVEGNGLCTSVHYKSTDFKQLLDEVFVISGIIKVDRIEVSVISRSRRLRLITLTETLIIPDITKPESNIIHCFEENNDKRIIAAITVYFQTLKNVQLSDKQIFTVFIKQSSAEKLDAFLKQVSLNLYLQVISQFLAGSMKRIEKPFLLRCP